MAIPGNPDEAKQIHELADVANVAVLAESWTVVDVPNPAYSPANPGTTPAFLTRRARPATGALPGPNDRLDLRKHVRCYSTDTAPHYRPGDSTLTGLPVAGLCLFTVCSVEFGPDGYGREYRLMYDPTGNLQVFVDGRGTGAKLPARWVLVGSVKESTSGIEPFSPLAEFYPAGKQLTHTPAGRSLVGLFQVVADLTATPGNPIPAPTGLPADAGRYKELPLSVAQQAPARYVSRPVLLDLLGEDGIVPGPLYRIIGRTDGFEILVQGLTVNAVSEARAYRVPAGADVPVVAGSYDVVGDKFTSADDTGELYRTTERIKHAVLLFQADDSDYISPGRIYEITDRPNGPETVYAAFDTTESRFSEFARVEGVPGLFRYDLANDQLTGIASDGGPGGPAELNLPQQVEAGKQYYWPTGVFEARSSFQASAAPVAGPNWRLVMAFSSYGDAQADARIVAANSLPFELSYRADAGNLKTGYASLQEAISAAPFDRPSGITVYPGAADVGGGRFGHLLPGETGIASKDISIFLGPGAVVKFGSKLLINGWQQFGSVAATVRISGPGLLIGQVSVAGNDNKTRTYLDCRHEGQVQINNFGQTSLASPNLTSLGPNYFGVVDSGPNISLLLRRPDSAWFGSAEIVIDRARLLSKDGSENVQFSTATTSFSTDGSSLTVIDAVLSAPLPALAGLPVTYVAAVPGGGGGIDFANPITLAQAATLQPNGAYYVTGAGYALTLPNPAQNIGAAVFVEIAADASGLFDIVGDANALKMYAGETMHFRATTSGWKRTGGQLLPMSIRLETIISQQDAIPNNTIWQVPLSVALEISGPQTLRNASTIVVQRSGRGVISGGVAVKSAVNAPVFYLVKRVRAGEIKYILQAAVIKFPDNYPSSQVAQVAFSLPVVVLAGDVYDLSLYAEGPFTLRGQNPGSECVLAYLETV